MSPLSVDSARPVSLSVIRNLVPFHSPTRQASMRLAALGEVDAGADAAAGPGSDAPPGPAVRR